MRQNTSSGFKMKNKFKNIYRVYLCDIQKNISGIQVSCKQIADK